ncbi:SGNH/GDSL hydrolase family protein [Sphingobacterium sp. lm-10]|uniref:SGNH/GDSL hydrolase family protein n=1 Tax=Sphingobacterium sp. lm-10 TaxID=2944904 RepID=UPI002021FF93|nr:SGNH/GDSL hydrolase family protein [Sphingobacterium sp. lm-10]MCL7989480.1 SGNH/GDSL hydrolase family protein [Sphingobacterium sp. lm-10]
MMHNTSAQNKADWANFSKYAAANPQEKSGQVVFMGNSITEGWKNSRPDFFTKNGYIGRGIGGQTSSQMLVRFRKDVLELQPRAVVILAGTNDIAQNQGFISLENVLGNIISMVELAQHHKIEVLLCSVLPAYEFSWRAEIQDAADQIIQLNTLIRYYADSNGIPFVDYHSALKDERNGLPEKYAKDGVHPTAAGYEIMEDVLQAKLKK